MNKLNVIKKALLLHELEKMPTREYIAIWDQYCLASGSHEVIYEVKDINNYCEGLLPAEIVDKFNRFDTKKKYFKLVESLIDNDYYTSFDDVFGNTNHKALVNYIVTSEDNLNNKNIEKLLLESIDLDSTIEG